MNSEIIHHGAKDGVTGSCHELRIDHDNGLLIDCGLFQGAETSPDGRAAAERLQVRFEVDTLRALVATHVHIDHVGRIPYLLAAGFKGPILCSEPSARLLPIVLADAFALGFTRDRRLIERYLAIVESRIIPLPYRVWHTVIDTASRCCRIRLQRAGHILGSAYVECDIQDKQTGGRERILFSGDLGAPWAPLLPAPRSPWRADIVVLESTYGDRTHEKRRSRRKRFERVLEHALADGGCVVIPAFSIGRTQELLYELEGLLHRNGGTGNGGSTWNRLKIYLDSPLASRFTHEYRRLQPFWDAEALARVRSGRRPLDFEGLITIDDHAAHLANVRKLSEGREPSVVIAASGMCAGGRIVNYLKAMLPQARNDVLFMGYQAAGTPGRTIQAQGARRGHVVLDGTRIPIRAGIHTLSGYSAHADRDDLTRFITRMRHLPAEIRLIHGEKKARESLAAHLAERTFGQVRIVP